MNTDRSQTEADRTSRLIIKKKRENCDQEVSNEIMNSQMKSILRILCQRIQLSCRGWAVRVSLMRSYWYDKGRKQCANAIKNEMNRTNSFSTWQNSLRIWKSWMQLQMKMSNSQACNHALQTIWVWEVTIIHDHMQHELQNTTTTCTSNKNCNMIIHQKEPLSSI